MCQDRGRIRRLPSEVAAQIKSSTAIPSLTSVVLGLVENALDAQASKIHISVDFARGACTVEDDGHGILPQEFMEDGELGKPYCTSRHNDSIAVYGKHGMFLASVAALSILSIISHHHSQPSLSTLLLHHSRPAARLVPAPSHGQLSNCSHGTRITVQDLFGNMPVRIKQRVVDHQERDRLERKDLELLKRQVIALLLSWQRPVSLRLTAGQTKSRRLNIRINDHAKLQKKNDWKDISLSKHANTSDTRHLETSLICSVLSQAGYIEPRDWGSWVKTSARTTAITVKGLISLEPAPSKQVQFMSLGIRPLFSEASGNVLYDEVNRLFAASSFGSREYDKELERDESLKDKTCKRNEFTNKELKGCGKGVDKWPMFYIHIELNGSNETERLERENVLSDVLKVVGAMIHGFLKENHFRPHTRVKGQSRRNPIRHTTTLLAPSASDFFSSWSRIKYGRQSVNITDSPSHTPSKAGPTSNEGIKPPVLARISDTTTGLGRLGHPLLATDEQETMFEWTNPVNKAKVLINSRTGLTAAKPLVLKRPNTAPPILSSASRSSSRRVNYRTPTPQERSIDGSWASQLFSKWVNPVFALAEEAIPQVTLKGLHLEASKLGRDPTCCFSDAGGLLAFNQSASTLSTRLSRIALAEARIISQVDKKFVLISMSNETQTLVLVDQHAADERIRIEELIAGLSIQAPTILQKPISFELSGQEQEVLAKHCSVFEHWGIQYIVSKPIDSCTCKLTVTTLPQSIAGRCRIEPKVLIELLRGEAWKLEETFTAASLHTPPQGLLDMLNSRACRSAIMFNDPLSIQDAETLISRLAQTKMPFQCAHGRPSMVPLVDLGRPEDSRPEGLAFGIWNGDNRNAEEGFGTAWKEWRRKTCPDDVLARS
ncbi:MAG: hypothetical protein Q9217_004941 [Psora testacea]